MEFQGLFGQIQTSKRGKEKPRGCENCPLNEVPGINKVMGRIRGRDILIVAQSPGQDENADQRELVGESGQFLWDELEKVGIIRKNCDIQNVVRCLPADATENSYGVNLKMRPPTKEEIHCCSIHTENIIPQIKARHILILGVIAAKAFLGVKSVPSKKIFWSEQLQATIYLADHPAFFIRGYGAGARLNGFRSTLQALADSWAATGSSEAQESLQTPSKGIHRPSRFGYLRRQRYFWVASKKKALKAARLILSKKSTDRVVVDIEDDDNQIFACGFSIREGISFTFDWTVPVVREIAKRLLENPSLAKAMQYGCTDVTKLKAEGITVRGFDWDTNIGAYFMQPGLGDYGLAAIAEREFPEFTGYKDEIIEELIENTLPEDLELPKNFTKLTMANRGKWLGSRGYYHLSKLPKDTIRLYNGGDCDLTKRAEVTQREAEECPQALMNLYIDLTFVLDAMQRNGPWFDYEQHRALETIYPYKEQKLLEEIRELTGDPEFNPGSPPQVFNFVYETLGLKYPFAGARGKQGKPNTQKKTMLMLTKQHPYPQKQIDWRKINKGNTTYIVGYKVNADLNRGRMRTKFNATGTATGRLSSGGKQQDPGVVNFQNIHGDPQMQNMCVADKRWRLVVKVIDKIKRQYAEDRWEEIIEKWIRKNMPDLKTYLILDYGQIEVRAAAQMSGDKNLQKDCETGDIHTTVGAVMTGWSPEQIRHDKLTRTLTKNCIAEGSLVLTDVGLVPIENVTEAMLVWDGIEFVSHDGVICKGIREVVSYSGLTATPDHKVWLKSGEKVSLYAASRFLLELAVSGDQETPVRYTADRVEGNFPDREWTSFRDGAVQCVQENIERGCGFDSRRHIAELSMSARNQVQRSSRENFSRSLLCDSATLRESKKSELGELRRARYRESIQDARTVCALCDEASTASDLQRTGDRQRGQRWTLRTGEPATSYETIECLEYTQNQICSIRRRASSGDGGGTSFEEGSRHDDLHYTSCVTATAGHSVARSIETQGTRTIRKAKVYDIVNAGPRHRFTANNCLVSNCHFGLLYGISRENLFNFIIAMTPPPKDEAERIEREKHPLTQEWVDAAYDRYFARYKKIKEYIENQREFAREHGYVQTLFGFRRKLNITDDDEEQDFYEMADSDDRGTYWGNIAINMPIQGTAHQLLICALVNLRRQPEKYSILGVPVMEVHDALYMSVNVLELFEAKKKAQYLLEKESLTTVKSDFPDIDWRVPIATEAEAGLRLGCKIELAEEMSIGKFMLQWHEKAVKQMKDLDKQLDEVMVAAV